jgi:hypothetical protein
MRRIFIHLACYAFLCLPLFLAAQSISPDVNTIQCPGQTITFTVTLPFNTGNPTGVSGTTVNMGTYNSVPANPTSQPSTPTFPPGTTTMQFTFNGQFVDDNTPQSFRVTAWNGTTNVVYNFTYMKIQSFKYTYYISQIAPTPASITAPRCQVNSYNISFANVKYARYPSTAVNGDEIGTASQYQYLLPSGWSLGATISNGSNWITATNSVSVISDASNGDGGAISIRAANSCGASLIQGPIVQIPISRPGPTLGLSTTATTSFCVGTTRTYTVSGVPAGATIAWSTSNSSVATVPAGSSGTSVVVTGTGNGTVQVKATVTQCTFVNSVFLNMSVGLPAPTLAITGADDNCPFVTANTTTLSGSSGFTWTLDAVVQSIHRSTISFQNLPGSHYICVTYTNSCGTSPQTCGYSSCPAGGGMLLASPNPGNGIFTISVNTSARTQTAKTAGVAGTGRFFRIRVSDQSGNIRKEFSYPSGVSRTTIDLSNLPNGIYILQTFNNKTWNSTQLVIAR